MGILDRLKNLAMSTLGGRGRNKDDSTQGLDEYIFGGGSEVDLPENGYGMRRGDLILSTAENRFSSLIRSFTNSPYSHIAMYVSDDEVIDSELRGDFEGAVKNETLDEAMLGKTVVHVFRVDTSQGVIDRAIEYCRKQIGGGYDLSGVVGIALKPVLPINILQQEDAYWCSELIERAFRHAGWPLVKQPGFVSPQDIAVGLNVSKIREIV